MTGSAFSASDASQLSTQVDLLCFSHLRWSFVTQRPQHLLKRAAAKRRVFYWEEPFTHAEGTVPAGNDMLQQEMLTLDGSKNPRCSLEILREGSVTVLRPHLSASMSESEASAAQASLLEALLQHSGIGECIAWYYTPMALSFTGVLHPLVTVYDCMDELSLFQGAPLELRSCEAQLMRQADVVFTGGFSLFEAKRTQHRNVHAFPSSIDQAHFAPPETKAELRTEPKDQLSIPRPRAGFYGVLDERLDVELLRGVARLLPQVQFILLGPVVKIDPATLPIGDNMHYLGSKRYEDLPAYLAGWDVALLPFARSEATRFISPTKTPEYLAAGKPVVSTPIRDVVREYGDKDLVAIADDPQSFANAIEAALQPPTALWRKKIRQALSETSWDRTWSEMQSLIARAAAQRQKQHRLLHLPRMVASTGRAEAAVTDVSLEP